MVWEQVFSETVSTKVGRRLNPNEPGLWKKLNWQAEIEQNGIEKVICQAQQLVERIPGFFPDETAIPSQVLLHEEAQVLRRMVLDPDAWAASICDSSVQSLITPRLLREFIEVLERGNASDAVRVWEHVLQDSPHREWLAANESDRLQKKTERWRFREFFDALDSVAEPSETYLDGLISFNPVEAYGRGVLTKEDWDVATHWAKGERKWREDKEDSEEQRRKSEKTRGYILARMISARAAEKVTLRFYDRLGFTVRDVSITQLDPLEQDWVTHDLELDGRPVDVKNARRPSTRAGYSEHAVSRLKTSRKGEDVTITGVRSPYLRIEALTGKQALPSASVENSVRVLGESSRAQLKALRALFMSETLQDLGITRGRGQEEYLPPWVFNYPEALYEEVGIQEFRTAVAHLVRQQPPSWDTVRRQQGHKALVLYIQAGESLPRSWRSALRSWEAALVDRIINSDAYRSLPHMFLTILTDFLNAVRERRVGYQPEEYMRLIYFGTTKGGMHAPLGLIDPLRSIYGLIKTLQLLWGQRQMSRLLEFNRFEFTAAGLLRGARANDPNHRVSLLAWCGGFRCDVSDLTIGRDKECACGYLICRDCDHCSNDCDHMALRRGV